MYTFDDRCISDLHKDVYGFRPNSVFFKEWQDMSNDEKQTEWDRLCCMLERVMQEDKVHTARATVRFEETVLGLMIKHEIPRSQAIDRIMKNEDAQDIEHLEYLLGLPFNYIKG